MNNPTCPNCKAPIPPDAPGGICPACALLGVVGPTAPINIAGMIAPGLEEVRAAFPELEVIGQIGQGGMGVVFKARQPKLDRLIALKILPPTLAAQPGFLERFSREARALAKLNHPHIVAVYDFGERAGFCYLAMEFVDGVNLRSAMREGVTPVQALQLVPHICEALQFAHDNGVLHRDIKPENILLDSRGVPKLADFGIAKLAGDPTAGGLTLSGAQLGTAAYMAPEQVEKPGSVDHRADIYSLGVVLYEMLTGELPLGRFAAPSEKAHVAPGVDAVVFRALEKERERRQQSATEMKTQVEHVGADGGAGAQAPAASRAASIGSVPAVPYRDLPWSRAAVWGVILVLLSGPVGGAFFATTKVVVSPSIESGSQLNGPILGNIIIFGFVFALAGTALGWKAVSDLRYHRGYLRGGGASVFAALFMPLFTLLLTVVANFDTIRDEISPSRRTMEGTIVASLAVIAAVAASVWAVRALWKAVHEGPPGLPLPPRAYGASAQDGANADKAWSTLFRLYAFLCALLLPVSALAGWRVPSAVHLLGGVVLCAMLFVFARAAERERRASDPETKPRGFRIAAQFAVVFAILAFSVPPLAIKILRSTAAEQRAVADERLASARVTYEQAERDLRDLMFEEAPDAAAKASKDARLESVKRRFTAADDELHRARSGISAIYAKYPDGDRHGIAATTAGVFGFLALSCGIVAWLRRPNSPTGTASHSLNPWPRRVFWIVIAVIVVPAVLCIIALCTPLLAKRKAAPPIALARISYEGADPIKFGSHALFVECTMPYGWLADFAFLIRDENGAHELTEASFLAAQQPPPELNRAESGLVFQPLANWEFSLGGQNDVAWTLETSVMNASRGVSGSWNGGKNTFLLPPEKYRGFRWEPHPNRPKETSHDLALGDWRVPFLIGYPPDAGSKVSTGVELFARISARQLKSDEHAEEFVACGPGNPYRSGTRWQQLRTDFQRAESHPEYLRRKAYLDEVTARLVAARAQKAGAEKIAELQRELKRAENSARYLRDALSIPESDEQFDRETEELRSVKIEIADLRASLAEFSDAPASSNERQKVDAARKSLEAAIARRDAMIRNANATRRDEAQAENERPKPILGYDRIKPNDDAGVIPARENALPEKAAAPVEPAAVDIKFPGDPAHPEMHAIVMDARTPFGSVIDFSWRVRDWKGEREFAEYSVLAAWERPENFSDSDRFTARAEWIFGPGEAGKSEFAASMDLRRVAPNVGSADFCKGNAFQCLDFSPGLRWKPHPGRNAAGSLALPATIPFLAGTMPDAPATDSPKAEVFLVITSRPLLPGEAAPKMVVSSGANRFENLAATDPAEPSHKLGPVEASPAQREAIRIAEQALADARKRFDAGVIGRDEVADAQLALDIAEALGDTRKIATLKVAHLEARLASVRKEFELGVITADSVRQIEGNLNAAKQELEKFKAIKIER